MRRDPDSHDFILELGTLLQEHAVQAVLVLVSPRITGLVEFRIGDSACFSYYGVYATLLPLHGVAFYFGTIALQLHEVRSVSRGAVHVSIGAGWWLASVAASALKDRVSSERETLDSRK